MARTKSLLNGYYALRWQIFERDNFTCQYCGQSAPNVKLEIDHKIPISEGGTDNHDNLTTSCYACNRGKSGLSIIRLCKGKRTASPYIPGILPDRWRQEEVLDYIKTHLGLRTVDIARELNITRGNAQMVIFRLNKRGQILKKERGWFPAM